MLQRPRTAILIVKFSMSCSPQTSPSGSRFYVSCISSWQEPIFARCTKTNRRSETVARQSQILRCRRHSRWRRSYPSEQFTPQARRGTFQSMRLIGDGMTEETKGITLPDFSASLARLIEGVSQSVVEVHFGKRGAASGFVWRDGLVVTADEALGDHTEAIVAIAGQHHEATIVGRDPRTDIAVLRLSGLTAPSLTLARELP